MNKIFEIVKECLDKYERGNKYFHELDEKIKYDEEIFEEMLKQTRGRVLILSGAFGFNILHYILKSKKHYSYIFLSGSPRKNDKVEIYAMNYYGGKRDNRKGIFLDDTFFSGRTYFYCKGFIEGKFDLEVDLALVAYDGHSHKLDYVDSFYRYFDYHTKDGKPLY
ncbi:MAG: hypothetical protein ACOCRX_10805 [Candidatus Woesearchaeota archaeon]